MDDITLAGDIHTDEADVNNHYADTGLKLNIASVKSLQKTQQPSLIHPFFPSL